MNNKKCPCCNKIFSFKDYYQQVFNFKIKTNLNDKEKDIICNQCNTVILTSDKNNKIYITLIALFFLMELIKEIISGMYIEISFTYTYVLFLLLLLPVTIYFVYMFIPLKCKE